MGTRAHHRHRRGLVTMLVYGDPTYDGRVQREAASLAAVGYSVRVLALQGSAPPNVPHVPGVEVHARRPRASRVLPGTKSPFHPADPGTAPPVRGGRIGWVAGYGTNLLHWGRWALRHGGTPDIWHAHDFTALLALALAGLNTKRPMVYDSHELYMELGSAARMPHVFRRLLASIEGVMARRARAVITVNQAVADELRGRYGVDPVVVMNCPPYRPVDRPGRLRTTLGLTDQTVLLYHGAVSEGRGIEVAVRALENLPDNVVLVVLGNGALVPWLRDQKKSPSLSDRLLLHPAVSLDELPAWVVDADVGLVLIAPTELNFVLSTPNKLFECIAAGVPVVASDFPAMRQIVLGHGVGVVTDPLDHRQVAAAVMGLLSSPDELAAMRRSARDASRDVFNWEVQATVLTDLYDRLIVGTQEPDTGGPPEEA